MGCARAVAVRPKALGCRVQDNVAARVSRDLMLTPIFSNVEERSGEPKSKSLPELLKVYGFQYLATWFVVYLPFLASFYVLIDGKKTGSFAVDINAAASLIDRLSNWLQSWSPFIIDSSAVRENPHAINFACAYLCADLVPTTVIALGLLSYYNRSLEKAGK